MPHHGHPASSAAARLARPVPRSSSPITVSYLDIEILGASLPACFIAKADVASWPFFGWLAQLQRTVFIDRKVRSVRDQRDSIERRLAAGDSLILFPEGTSGDGLHLLPFKSSLFAAVEDAAQRHDVAVQPVSVAYTRLDGMPLGRFYRPLLRLVRRHGIGPASLDRARPRPLDGGGDFPSAGRARDFASRKELAEHCRRVVAAGLDAALVRPAMRAKSPRRRRHQSRGGGNGGANEGAVLKKLYIKTYGCQMNVYDSARMAELMAPEGYAACRRARRADLILLNTCHIREKAAEKLFSDLGRCAGEGAQGAGGRKK